MAAGDTIEKLKRKTRSGSAEDRLEAQLELAVLYNQQKRKEAFAMAADVLEKAIKSDNKNFIARAHLQLAIYFCRTQTNSFSSLNHCSKALSMREHFTLRREVAEIFKTVGVNYYYLGEMQKAQESYKNALEILLGISKKTDFEIKDIADIYYNLAILNRSAESLHLRKEYLEQAQNFYEQIGYENGVARCYDGMGVYYFYLKNKRESFGYLQKALDMMEALKDADGINLVCNNIGTLKIQQGDYEEGFKFLFRSLEMRKKSGNKISTAICYINIGNAYIQQKKYKDALRNLTEAEKILRLAKSKVELSSAIFSLASCYRAVGDYKKACAYQEEYINLREELHNYELEKAYDDTSARFSMEITEKDALIDRLQNFEIANYIHRLEMSNDELRQFAHAASHDLKEPLRTITSFVNLLEKHCEQKIDATGREYLNYIVSATKRLDLLVKDILDLSKVNRDEFEPQEVDLNETLKQVVKDLGKEIAEKKAKIKVGKLPLVMADPLQMFQLFLNLLSNAIKYNESAAPTVSVKASKSKGAYTIAVSDNGIGIPEEYQDKVFEIFQRLHPREKYSGTGIGLTLCKRIVERHKGKIWFERNYPKGSVFYVTLPS
ncbi:MAG: tetratricopeptide repeat protein [Chitinophagales bacterium]